MKKLLLITTYILVAAAAVLVWSGQVEAADWRHIDQLGGVPVTVVKVNPSNRLEVAALAGDLWLSHDGGLTWRDQAFPAGLPASVAYDPVHPGVIAVGTYNTCLLISNDGGLTWAQHKIPFNYFCNVRQVIGTKSGFVFSVQQVIGYTSHLFRLENNGSLTDLSSFPDINPGASAYDQELNRLCIGTSKELYCSIDDGASWDRLAAANQIGNSPNNILIHSAEPWLVSDKGVMVYRQNTWLDLVYNDSSKGNPPVGLVINGDDIIYGSDSDSTGDVEIFTSTDVIPSAVHTGLNQYVFDLARSGDDLFAATRNGLFVTRDVLHSEAKIRRPVIVIPGITGSLPSLNPAHFWQLELDPYTHTYDPLLARLRAVGYIDGKTLFPMPYNWERPNDESARVLADDIQKVKMICGCDKVDVVAHSMGGLVARSYIEGPTYLGDINKLIEVGTPNAGSLSAYYTWEGGELYSGGGAYNRAKTDILGSIFHLQALSSGYISFKEFIHEQVTSTQELLPVFNYIQGRTYPDGYPRNVFLEELNSPAAKASLAQRVKLRIIGGDTFDTLRQLMVGDPGPGANFPDGRVESVMYGPGDGTVLTSSLQALAPADDFEDAEHGRLTTVAQDTIVRYLLEDDTDQNYLDKVVGQIELQRDVQSADQLADVTSYHMIYVLGKGAASLSTPDGEQLNLNVKDIPDSYYSGDAGDEHIFSIPDPRQYSYSLTFTADQNSIPQSVTFGGIVIGVTDESGEPPAAQGAVELEPGDTVGASYDASTQVLKMGEIKKSTTVSKTDSESSADTIGQGSEAIPQASDLGQIQVTGGSNSVGQKLSSLSPDSSVFTVQTDPLLVAALPAGNQKIAAKFAPAQLAASPIQASAHYWRSFGLEFWLAVAVIVMVMLAFVLWRLAQGIQS